MDRQVLGRYNSYMGVYPLKFRPIFKQRIWGGQKLRDYFGKDIPAGEKIGESWELADLAEGQSIVANGTFEGKSLGELVNQFPEQIMGNVDFSGQFPLLIKFLDAEDILSMQVHPDPETCRRMGTGEPKTECWYIISAAKGAYIYKGLKPGVTKEQFAEAIRQGKVAELSVKVPVSEGQCHLLPAGTTHAIGAGLLVAEIQTPSDTTYRVFDWNRVDESGKSRQLHIEQALESINFGQSQDDLPVTNIGRLVDCEYFKIDKGHQAKGCEVLLSAGKMRTLIILSGMGEIISGDGSLVDFNAGDTLLIPCELEAVARFGEDTQYLTVTL